MSVPSFARAADLSGGRSPALLARARAALDRHGSLVQNRETIGIVDFGVASRLPRFHIVNMSSGRVETLLVAHGRGSDPDHSGWLERFSNEPGSAASSAGAYLTGATYEGKHGLSRRLIGLDPQNSNAESRAIVIHSAWYVNNDIVRQTGKLGRSEGCLAVAGSDLPQVLERLGPGSLIYAGKAS
nr:murein L,D-transpeptidase catalytic domain family protein [Sphingobium nicotianae]